MITMYFESAVCIFIAWFQFSLFKIQIFEIIYYEIFRKKYLSSDVFLIPEIKNSFSFRPVEIECLQRLSAIYLTLKDKNTVFITFDKIEHCCAKKLIYGSGFEESWSLWVDYLHSPKIVIF